MQVYRATYPNEANFILNDAVLPDDCSSDVHDMFSVALQVLFHTICGVIYGRGPDNDGLSERIPGKNLGVISFFSRNIEQCEGASLYHALDDSRLKNES